MPDVSDLHQTPMCAESAGSNRVKTKVHAGVYTPFTLGTVGLICTRILYPWVRLLRVVSTLALSRDSTSAASAVVPEHPRSGVAPCLRSRPQQGLLWLLLKPQGRASGCWGWAGKGAQRGKLQGPNPQPVLGFHSWGQRGGRYNYGLHLPLYGEVV